MKKQQEKLLIEERIADFIDALKNKSTVSIKNLEEFYSLVGKIQLYFERLKESRDKWRVRAEKAEKELKEYEWRKENGKL